MWNYIELRPRMTSSKFLSNCGEPHQIKAFEQWLLVLPWPVLHVHVRIKASVFPLGLTKRVGNVQSVLRFPISCNWSRQWQDMGNLRTGWRVPTRFVHLDGKSFCSDRGRNKGLVQVARVTVVQELWFGVVHRSLNEICWRSGRSFSSTLVPHCTICFFCSTIGWWPPEKLTRSIHWGLHGLQ